MQLLVGSTIVVNNWERHYIISTIEDSMVRLTVYLISVFLIVGYPLIGLFVNAVLNFDPHKEVKEYFKKPLCSVIEPKDRAMAMVFFLFLVGSIIVVMHIYLAMPAFPLDVVLHGTDLEKALFRSKMRFDFEGNIYVYNLYGKTLIPVLSFISVAYTSLLPRKIIWRFYSFLLIVLSMLALTADLQKAPLLLYFIGLFVLWTWLKGGFNFSRMFFLSLISMAVIIVLYVTFSGSDSLIVGIRSALYRLMLGQIGPLYIFFDYFPDKHSFVIGGDLPEWMTDILGIEHTNTSRMIMEYFNPEGIKAGTAGLMNTIFIGQAYANFGPLGVAIFAIYIFALLQFIFIAFIRLPKTPIFVGVFAYLTTEVPMMLMRGALEFVYNPRFLFLVLTLSIIVLFSRSITHSAQYTNSHR
ncbi:MAG: hypothetical protein ACPLQP_05660 [Moorellaceae bacterium]